MHLIKAILGGLVGGAIGTAVYYYMNPETPAELPWVAIVTGLLTGVGVRIFCGSGRSFLTGVVALAMTFLMLVGWPIARDMQSLMSNNRDFAKPVKVDRSSASVSPDSDSKTDSTESDEDKTAASTGDSESSDDETDNSTVEGSSDSSGVGSERAAAPSIANGSAVPAPEKPSLFGYDPKQVNEAIAFGLAGLLAFVLGTGRGGRGKHSGSAETSTTENA